uniref:Glycosyltransferase n=1 Tax=Kalanchoe fedtschenkoi TaxID=63787 RepID=A0A7N0TTN7_KALFE
MADNEQPHFVLFPFMAQGHTIPMIDIAKLLAQRGAYVPCKGGRATSRLRELRCPSFKLSLLHFIYATTLLQPQLETLLITMNPKPSCLLADMSFSYASGGTRKLGIPRILFHGTCSFSLLCAHHIFNSNALETVSDLSDTFQVPHMPHEISFRASQVRATLSPDKSWNDFHRRLLDDEKGSYGVVMNTFQELEPEYVREYEKAKEKKVWCVGPVSLCNEERSDKFARGNPSSVDENECLRWLDSWEPGAVIYACLGSLCNLPAAHMLELGAGLEASGRPFIWVIRSGGDMGGSKELKEMMAETGLEGRLKESSRGVVIWGWAPQLLLLSHPAVGGILTHCGWNSSLEGVTAGLPMLTWPLFSEQFYNEKLLVQVLRIGVPIGIERMMNFGKEDEAGGVQVNRERVKEGVEDLMDGGVEGLERRTRAKKLADMAKKVMQEGGSSHANISKLIEDVRNFKA